MVTQVENLLPWKSRKFYGFSYERIIGLELLLREVLLAKRVIYTCDIMLQTFRSVW